MKAEARVFDMASQASIVVFLFFSRLYCIVFKISMEIIQSLPGRDFFLEAILTCACERWMPVHVAKSRFRIPRTDEEESALVSETRPKSRKYKNKWAVEIFGEWQRTRTFKFPDLEVGSDLDFHLVCNVEDNTEDMNALSLNYWLAKLAEELANKKGGHEYMHKEVTSVCLLNEIKCFTVF